MHRLLASTAWSEEIIRNEDKDQEIEIVSSDNNSDKDLSEDNLGKTTRKLAGCMYYKAVRQNDNYSAQIRVEERYRQQLIYFSALILRKDGRGTHHYHLEDLQYFETKEFNFISDEKEHPEFLSAVYQYVCEVREKIDREYFS